MPIEQVIAYVAVCDGCDDSCDSWTDYDDEEAALEWCFEQGWERTQEGLFCPACLHEGGIDMAKAAQAEIDVHRLAT